jgi:DNA-binding response OmpR family regulator
MNKIQNARTNLQAVDRRDAHIEFGTNEATMDIACITVNPHLSGQIEHALGALGNQFTTYRSSTSLARCLDQQRHDVILLACENDVIDTLLSCRLGVSDAGGPAVILLSGHDCGIGVDRALAAGVDDYISLSGGLGQLATRIRACVSRRQRKTDRNTLTVQDVQLDRRDGSARLRGVTVDLTRREFMLAWVLFSNAGTVVTVRTLAEVVWGASAEVAKRTIEQHVYRLRCKLQLKNAGALNLSAVYGRGYRLDENRSSDEATSPGGFDEPALYPSGSANGTVHWLPALGGAA